MRYDILVSGYAYAACDTSGLQVIDVTDPTSPVLLGSADTPGEAGDVVVADGFAYVADKEYGISIIDVSVPAARNVLLRGAYPNPFNPRTTIAFELAVPGETRLRIFDVSGRLIRTLIDGTLLARGDHEYEWDGRDNGGRSMPSGIYFSRLEVGGYVESRRMALVR